MPGIDGQSPRLADIQKCAAITAQRSHKMVIERNQIFILLRSVLRGYRMGLLLFGIGNGGLAMWYWQCGIAIGYL
nr:MAG TPA: hypothetical protein [Caudoviricetes sp.]